jgi:phospholipase C
VSGETVTVEPFLIGPDENANVSDSSAHGRDNLARKLHVSGNTAAMDQFAFVEYSHFAGKGGTRDNAKGTQFARVVMSHVDCDTIPFLWQYASRFALFDNIFAAQNAPSTPNAIAMLAGQSVETQWVRLRPDGRAITGGNHSGPS